MTNNDIARLGEAVESSQTILIIQSEVPDGDSLASALALESIFGDMGKKIKLHCAVNIPAHLQYLSGWDRVAIDVEPGFDLAIIVDTSTESLLQKTLASLRANLQKTPVFVLDHHTTDADLTLKAIIIKLELAVSTGEVIYDIAQKLNWTANLDAKKFIATSILYDSLGLMTESTTAHSIRIIAELVEGGVSLSELDDKRREMMKRDKDITKYKGQLISKIAYECDGKLAYVHVPWEEIEKYSSRYNPAMLVLEDMRLTQGVELAVVFKTYPDGKLTAKLRSTYGKPIAGQVAEHFGGGGHPYAAGFKLQPGDLNQVISEINKLLIKWDNE